MSRRRTPQKRKLLVDPKYRDQTLARFISRLMRDGKKSVAERLVYGALNMALERFKDEDSERGSGEGTGGRALSIFNRALDNIAPHIEVRSRRVGGSTYQIPCEVRPARRQALAMRWLIQAALARKSDKGMVVRLANEICDAANGRGGAVTKRENTYKMAEANRAFAHYRW